MWHVKLHDDFRKEADALPAVVRQELTAQALLLAQTGPLLGRPKVDTLKGSAYSNMKELRFYADNGVWRVAFAFDPERQAVLLVAGDKAGVNEQRFYKQLIATADTRFSRHLAEYNKR